MLTALLIPQQKCSPCRKDNSCVKGRCVEHRSCPVGHELKGELCCPPIRYVARGDDGYGDGKGKFSCCA
jgi:hypothetical protein